MVWIILIMKNLFILLVILFFSQIVLSQSDYNTYNNARFGYLISYPSNLIPKGEADNGDGQVFEAKDKSAKLTVWGSNNALSQSLKQIYNDNLKEYGKAVTYKNFGETWYVISGKRNGKIFYQKTINDEDVYFTFVFEYAESKRKAYDKAVTKIAKSFK